MKNRTQSDSEASRGGSGGARSAPLPCLTVLHVDDDPNDTELLMAATRKAGVPFVLENVADAEQAIAYLSGSGKFADRTRYPLPSLILLDLKLPRATGFEILKWVRCNSRMKDVPVVILSGSELHEDMRKAYAGGANSYLVKPLGFEALVGMVRNISSVWLSVTSPGQRA